MQFSDLSSAVEQLPHSIFQAPGGSFKENGSNFATALRVTQIFPE
jgi:hypothetical protein